MRCWKLEESEEQGEVHMKARPTVSVQVDKVAEGLHYGTRGYQIRQSWWDSQDVPQPVVYPDR